MIVIGVAKTRLGPNQNDHFVNMMLPFDVSNVHCL